MISKWLRLVALCLLVTFCLVTMYRTVFPPRADVTMMCSNDIHVCEAWKREIRRELGLEVRFLALPTQEALKRIESTSSGGGIDVWVGGPSENYRYAASKGLLRPAVLSNARDIPEEFRDPQGRWFGIYASILGFCSNPDVLERRGLAVPTSWEELGSQELRDWVSAPSPLSSGTGYSILLATDAAGLTKGESSNLLDNVGRFTRSGNAPSEVAAHGEAAVAISFAPYCENKRTKSGRQLVITYPSEGTSFEIASGAVLNSSVHVEAAQEVLNWLLSPKGQLVARDSGLNQKPVNAAVDGNIKEAITSTDVTILHIDEARAVKERTEWMTWFSKLGDQ